MKLGFKLQNLLGTVYKEGDLVFTDGDCLISPVGNKVTVFDLKSNKTQTLQLECRKNIKCLALSPQSGFLMAVDEDDRSIMYSLKTNTSLHYMTFKNIVTDLKFSPNGRYLAVTLGRQVQLWQAPGFKKEFAAWNLLATFSGFYSNTTCLDWSSDSRFIVVGSEDMTSRVFSVHAMRNFQRSLAAGHKNSVVGAFFEKDSLNFYSVSKDGALFHWTCDHSLSSIERVAKKRKAMEEEDQGVMELEAEKEKVSVEEGEEKDSQEDSDDVVLAKFTKASRNFFFQDGADLTSVDYHQTSRVLVAGFSSGVFLLYELPEFIQIHALSISKHKINTVAFNTSGEWLAFGSASLGQLLVWEWQSESYILKQQGHFYDMNTLAYSPDGHLIATGGDDGKVKVWNTGTGFCFVTFHEHTAGVTAVAFNQNGKVVLSASLDGTVRAFDLNRYRNFRTFTSPRLAQFSCLAVDHSGEIISAGARDFFEIYVWSMQTGRLLEVLSGHEGPVSSLAFSPSKSFLVSGSWDKTLKVWDILGRGGAIETMPFGSDVIALCFRADGLEVALATLDGRITFCVPETATELGSIEGRPDLGGGRRSYDKVTAKRLAEGKCFTSLCYSADGQSILAGGKSKFVCIYHVKQQILLKKFQISCNRSLEGIQEHLNSRHMTEAGAMEELDTDSDNEDISLPGVAKGDFSSRRVRPEIQTKALTFSPTGRSWAATTTEGLLIYSLDASVVFSPFNLDVDVTPEKIDEALKRKEYTMALILSLRLNEESHIDRVLESIPSTEIDGITHALTSLFAEKLLFHMGRKLEGSRHFEFYLRWTRSLLTIYGRHLKDNAVRVMPLLRTLQKTLTKTLDSLGKLCDSNRYMLKYLIEMPKQSAKEDAEQTVTQEPQQISDLL